ncbi:MAG: hypothetical protein ACR2NX_07515 [Chthoniobacterales bacterium]
MNTPQEVSAGDLAGLAEEKNMRRKILVAALLSFCALRGAEAQEANNTPSASAAEVSELRQQVQALTEMVKTLQQQVKDQQASAPDALPQNPEPAALAGASATPAPPAAAASAEAFPTTDDSVVASNSSSSSAAPAAPVDANGAAFPTTDTSVTAAGDTSSASSVLTQPLPIMSTGGGKTYMNISFDGMFALAYSSDRNLSRLEVGDHDPQQRGFNARNAEIALDGAVDPYFEGFANIVLKLDNNNETTIELEEAFLQTTSLPWGLQLKAGQFFADFGRINPTHPHTWDFSDAPVVIGRFLGSDGLRGVGAQLSWTLPVPWYSQIIGGVQNGRGNTGYSFRNPGDDGLFYGRLTTDREARGLQDFVWVPRWENSFNLSDTQTVLGGISGAFGSNETGGNARTQIYGVDMLYKWKSPRAEGGFPFVKWQTEALYRRFEAGRGIDMSFPVAETLKDWGVYSQVLWGFKKGWIVGARGERLEMQDSHFTDDYTRQSRTRLAANLTWLPTEFSRIRLQYNHDFLDQNFFLDARQADELFLQFEFILGAHGAHKF